MWRALAADAAGNPAEPAGIRTGLGHVQSPSDETDAKLRLASLQLLLRRPSSATTIPNRLAEIGPSYYDPFTGLPMLWSERQAMVYSAGRDRFDDGGDPHFDLAVPVRPAPSQGETQRKAALSSQTLSPTKGLW